jgi:hypothetical protein
LRVYVSSGGNRRVVRHREGTEDRDQEDPNSSLFITISCSVRASRPRCSRLDLDGAAVLPHNGCKQALKRAGSRQGQSGKDVVQRGYLSERREDWWDWARGRRTG